MMYHRANHRFILTITSLVGITFLITSCHIVEKNLEPEQKPQDPVMELYASEDISVIKAAIFKVRETKNQKAIRPLAQLMYKASSSLSIRVMAAIALADLEGEKALPRVKRLLEIKDSSLIQAGLALLERLVYQINTTPFREKCKELGQLLLKLIQEEYAYIITSSALKLLGEIGYKAAYDEIYRIAMEEHSLFRGAAIYPLVQLTEPEELADIQKFIEEYLKKVADAYKDQRSVLIDSKHASGFSPDTLVKFRMAYYAIKYGETSDLEYLEYLSKIGLPHITEVLKAEYALLENPHISLGYLNQALDDVDEIIQMRAARILETIGDNESVQRMVEKVEQFVTQEKRSRHSHTSCPAYIPAFIQAIMKLSPTSLESSIPTLLEHPETQSIALEAVYYLNDTIWTKQQGLLDHCTDYALINKIIAFQFNQNRRTWLLNQIQSPNRLVRLAVLVYLKKLDINPQHQAIQVWIEEEQDTEIQQALKEAILN